MRFRVDLKQELFQELFLHFNRWNLVQGQLFLPPQKLPAPEVECSDCPPTTGVESGILDFTDW